MTPTSKLVSTAITGSGVKLDWENPITLPPGTRTVATSSLVSTAVTGTGVHLGWQGRFHITCRLVWPQNVPAADWPGPAYPTSAALSVVPAAPTPDGAVRLIAYADDAELVKQYARTLAESAVAAGAQNVRVEVTDAARQPICDIAL